MQIPIITNTNAKINSSDPQDIENFLCRLPRISNDDNPKRDTRANQPNTPPEETGHPCHKSRQTHD